MKYEKNQEVKVINKADKFYAFTGKVNRLDTNQKGEVIYAVRFENIYGAWYDADELSPVNSRIPKEGE